MLDHFNLAERGSPEICGFDPGSSKGRYQDASAMAFAIRRTRYFSNRAQGSLLSIEDQIRTSASRKENTEAQQTANRMIR